MSNQHSPNASALPGISTQRGHHRLDNPKLDTNLISTEQSPNPNPARRSASIISSVCTFTTKCSQSHSSVSLATARTPVCTRSSSAIATNPSLSTMDSPRQPMLSIVKVWSSTYKVKSVHSKHFAYHTYTFSPYICADTPGAISIPRGSCAI